MKQKNKTPSSAEETSQKITKLRCTYEAIVFLFEHEDFQAALCLTKHLMTSLSSLAVFIESESSKFGNLLPFTFKENKSDQSADLKQVNEWIKKRTFENVDIEKDEELIEEFYQLVLRLNSNFTSLKKAFHILFPQIQPWKKALVKNWKKIAIGSGILLILVVAVFSWKSYWSKRRGLKAEYFSSKNLEDLFIQKVDPKIDFNWGKGKPFDTFDDNYFSIRWTGFLYAPEEGEYQFVTQADDGVHLWVKNELLIEDWTVHREAVNRAKITLSQGFHPITLEYFENRGKASVKLLWKRPSDFKPTIIPSKFLIPDKKFIK